jgi:hypothetical protein
MKNVNSQRFFCFRNRKYLIETLGFHVYASQLFDHSLNFSFHFVLSILLEGSSSIVEPTSSNDTGGNVRGIPEAADGAPQLKWLQGRFWLLHSSHHIRWRK